MKQKIIIIVLAVIGIWGLSSCDDYLYSEPKDRVDEKVVWESENNVKLYINYFYLYLNTYGGFGSVQFKGDLTDGLTDTFKYGSYGEGAIGANVNKLIYNPNMITPGTNILDVWGDAYQAIRRVNEFMHLQDKYSTFSDDLNNRIRAEILFFRAFVYFQLAKRHNGVILRPDIDDIINNKQKDKATASETWDFIEKDLDFAIEYLPEEWPADDKGRITKGAAYALKSRAMLYAERWQKVIDAADEVLKLNYDLETNYEDAWKGNNKESILEYNYAQTKDGPYHGFDFTFAPFGDHSTLVHGAGTPTQEMVESYELANTGGFPDWTPWHTTTTNRPPYELLEPRFHASVLYNGASWKGKVMENTVGGTHGRFMNYRDELASGGRTVTGYYLRKLLDETFTEEDFNTKHSVQPWVEIRLAEVYLNRAEAHHKLGNDDKALDDLNEIRSRVDLPDLSGLTGDAVFAAIRQERKVELFAEGHLYWDMRRWKLAYTEYNDYRAHGIRITDNEGTLTYEYVECDNQDRKFNENHYNFPIPTYELINNTAINQFNEWK